MSIIKVKIETECSCQIRANIWGVPSGTQTASKAYP